MRYFTYENPIIRPFYLPQAAALCTFPCFDDDIYFPLQYHRRFFHLQLCGKNPFCCRQSDYARHHGRGCHRLYGGHRRQRHCIENLRGRKAGTGKLLFLHDDLWSYFAIPCIIRPLLYLHPADLHCFRGTGRIAPQLCHLRQDFIPRRNRLCTSICFPEFFCGGGKARTDLKNIRCRRADKCCARFFIYCGIPLGNRRCRCRYGFGAGGGWYPAAALFFPEKSQPPAAGKSALRC